jgi:hypothetical protein
MRVAGHVARLWERRGTRISYWWESHRERDRYEDQEVDGWIKLRWIF